jgi:hypothetical protein
MTAMKRVRLDWKDTRMNVSTNQVAGFLKVGWLKAFALMESGEVVSDRIGVKSQPYYRTSMRNLKAFMDGKQPTG